MYENNYGFQSQGQFNNGMQMNQGYPQMVNNSYPGYQNNSFNSMNSMTTQPTNGQLQMQTQQRQTIPGRMVQNEESIIANEVPMDGNYSTFIQQDFKKIYLKTWGSNGMIETKRYLLVEENPDQQMPTVQNDSTSLILERLDRIEEQLKKYQQKSISNNYRNGKQNAQNKNREVNSNE